MSRPPLTLAKTKTTLHPRNRHRDGYDFTALTETLPALAPFVSRNRYGDWSINFVDPLAVKCLNAALLKHFYQINYWDIPPGFLCPPIPGRVDYLHYVADLLNAGDDAHNARLLDIGCGANLIYPLLGFASYGWSFVAVDISNAALNAAQQLIAANQLSEHIELRQQRDHLSIFKQIIQPDDYFNATVCNPPFHRSAQQASAGTTRKWRNLKARSATVDADLLNFGGQQNELHCEGGEAAFIHRMIGESVLFKAQVRWFTTLVSKADNLASYQRVLKKTGCNRINIVTMKQGQKSSHMLAWTFI